jgi:uncharacterized damage-inducible protein DinB
MKEHFHKLLDYDDWANGKVFDLVKEHPLDNSRIAEMLYHIFMAQRVWASRVLKQQYNGNLFTAAPLHEIAALKKEAREVWLQCLNEHALDEIVQYKNTKGESYSTLLKDILTHVVNHSTHHRAEIITLLRSEFDGIRIPPTDYIFYLRQA